MTVEPELMLRLAQVADRRVAGRARIGDLAVAADSSVLVAELARSGLFPLLGRRLLNEAPQAAPEGFASQVEDACSLAAGRALMLEAVTIQVAADFAAGGIAMLPLKGPFMARWIHGDPSLRWSLDADVLVGPGDLEGAVERLVAAGWRRPPDHVDRRGRPSLHFTFVHADPWMPRLELHWRVHWYEERFSAEMLARSQPDGPVLRATPADELTALLLFLARDGFLGLRLPADVAAWWDARGAELAPGALDEAAGRHPQLAPAIATAAVVADRLVGVPSARYLSPGVLSRASLRAVRLANPFGTGDIGQQWGNIVLVDGLLAPPAGRGAFLHRRFIAPPEPHPLGPDPESPRGRIERWLRAPRIARRAAVALWRTRGGRTWAPLPD